MAKTNRRKPRYGLQSLLGEFPAEVFLRDVWPLKTKSFSGDAARLHGLIDIPEFASIDSILSIPCRAIVVQNNWEQIDYADIPTARKLYDWGYQVYLREIRTRSKAFDNWIGILEAELGLARKTITANVFCCTKDCRSTPRWHFDPQEGFTVQVRGTKRWLFADNRHVVNPTFNYALGNSLTDRQKHAFPNGPPAKIRDFESADLVPGSVVFLPRGAWHTTQPTADSVHLDLEIPTPTWINLLAHAVNNLLAPQAAWRAPIIVGNQARDAAARSQLAGLLESVAGQIRGADPQTLLRDAGFSIGDEPKSQPENQEKKRRRKK